MKKNTNQGWRNINGREYYFRSLWEANYARFLDFSKRKGHLLDWDYECKTFWFEGVKRGTVSYLPDFWVKYSDHEEWHEVKGYMDAKSKTKINRFKKYYPQEIIRVISSMWFKNNNPTMRALIKEWEYGGF